MEWLNCLKIYENGEVLEDVISDHPTREEILGSFQRYCKVIRHQPEYSVWYDKETKECIGMDTSWENAESRKSCFISHRSRFVKHNRWNANYVLNYYGETFGTDLVGNEEIMYLNLPQIEKYKDSKILIVGGGPSAAAVDWDPDEYDYIFSCNHFFLYDKMKNIDVSFTTSTEEVDKSAAAKEFHDYMQNNSTIICFDDRMVESQKKEFAITKERYPDRSMYLHTRFRAKNGSCAKLLVIATLFGAKEIHVVGMDGVAKDDKLGHVSPHVFQPGKVWQGTVNYHMEKQHYVVLWDYLLNCIGKEVKYQNLGEGCETNLVTDISKKMFPLEKNND